MGERLTLAAIDARHVSEWVLLAEPEVGPDMRLTAGRVAWHSKDRDEVYQKAIDLRLDRSATHYTGKLPDNTAVIL